MIGALTYEEVLRATMRSNWIHALWLFAVVVLIWVCTILFTLYSNRKKKPKDKDDSWQVSVFLLALFAIGYGILIAQRSLKRTHASSRTLMNMPTSPCMVPIPETQPPAATIRLSP